MTSRVLLLCAVLAPGLAAGAAARAADCPSTCVIFDSDQDAAQFVAASAEKPAAEAALLLKQAMARHAARILPEGTQFVLLAAHKLSGTEIYYGVQLPGADVTRFLVAVK